MMLTGAHLLVVPSETQEHWTIQVVVGELRKELDGEVHEGGQQRVVAKGVLRACRAKCEEAVAVLWSVPLVLEVLPQMGLHTGEGVGADVDAYPAVLLLRKAKQVVHALFETNRARQRCSAEMQVQRHAWEVAGKYLSECGIRLGPEGTLAIPGP
eukprot:1189365-Prorocentrum_minimum.AAC.1